MDPRLLTQAATLLHQVVTQQHPEPCSLDVIEAAVRKAADETGRLTAEMWAQAVVDVAEAERPVCACGTTMLAKRKASRVLLLLVGLLRLTVRRYRCPACGAWACPALAVLQLPHRARLTRAVQELVVDWGLTWSFAVAAQRLGRYFPGVNLSPKTIERVTKATAAVVAVTESEAATRLDATLSARAEAHFSGAELTPEAVEPLGETFPSRPPLQEPKRVYLGLDGVLVRARQAKEWVEVQVGSLWSAWEWRSGCQPPRRQIKDSTFVARAESWEALGHLVWHEFVARGGRLGAGREVVVLGDGASGIRSLWEFYFPRALALLDPWHLWEKVKQRAREVFRSRKRAVAAAKEVYQQLRKGDLAAARRLVEGWEATNDFAAAQRQRLLAFLERNADTIRDYDALRVEGYMVGAGLSEKAHDLVVVPRMKNGKMHWSREGANAVALLRARVLSDPELRHLPP